MTDDLIEFIRARLDEDEVAAKACASGIEGSWRGTTEWHASERRRAVYAGAYPVADYIGELTGHAEHIARHDPARVLRAVAAKRGLLKPHEPSFYDDQLGCGECGWPSDYPDPAIIPQWWPCQTVRLIASEWDDHADYLPDWAP